MKHELESMSRFEALIRKLIQYTGDDPDRQGLQRTPMRVARAYKEWFGGYHQDPESVCVAFEDGAEDAKELVIETDIPVFSHCEHHMAPFFGVAHVGYIPHNKIIGLSKMHRLVNIYARRLQVQERLGSQIARALHEGLKPLGVGVALQCRHLCKESRGVRSVGSFTQTVALTGVMLHEDSAKAEFMNRISASRYSM